MRGLDTDNGRSKRGVSSNGVNSDRSKRGVSITVTLALALLCACATAQRIDDATIDDRIAYYETKVETAEDEASRAHWQSILDIAKARKEAKAGAVVDPADEGASED